MSARPLVATAALALLATVTAEAAPAPATLVLFDGNVVTGTLHQPAAQALALRGERIAAVGSDARIKAFIGPHTRKIDLRGMTVVPGFIDSHAHFLATGEDLSEIDLGADKAPTWHDVVAKVAAAVKRAKPGEWILGYGWHQEHWTRRPQPNFEGLPTGRALDAVSPDNPVLLSHASGHAIFVNAKALELAGIGPHTPNPPGGEIVRDDSGRAIGMLRPAWRRFAPTPTTAPTACSRNRSSARWNLESLPTSLYSTATS